MDTKEKIAEKEVRALQNFISFMKKSSLAERASEHRRCLRWTHDGRLRQPYTVSWLVVCMHDLCVFTWRVSGRKLHCLFGVAVSTSILWAVNRNEVVKTEQWIEMKLCRPSSESKWSYHDWAVNRNEVVKTEQWIEMKLSWLIISGDLLKFKQCLIIFCTV